MILFPNNVITYGINSLFQDHHKVHIIDEFFFSIENVLVSAISCLIEQVMIPVYFIITFHLPTHIS